MEYFLLFCSGMFSRVKQRESSDVGDTLDQIKLNELKLLVVFKTDKVNHCDTRSYTYSLSE